MGKGTTNKTCKNLTEILPVGLSKQDSVYRDTVTVGYDGNMQTPFQPRVWEMCKKRKFYQLYQRKKLQN